MPYNKDMAKLQDEVNTQHDGPSCKLVLANQGAINGPTIVEEQMWTCRGTSKHATEVSVRAQLAEANLEFVENDDKARKLILLQTLLPVSLLQAPL